MDAGELLITGADGDLGHTVAARLLAEGWTLYASAYRSDSAELLKKDFPDAYGKKIHAVLCDLAKQDEVDRFVASAKDPSALVHLAGGFKGGESIADYSDADFDFLFNLNTRPCFLLLHTLMPLFKKRKEGSIVTIAAKPVLHPAKGNALYAASKSALAALTLNAAEEGRKHGVRANCILPATLRTKNNRSWASDEQFENFTPTEDVADVIAFLVSGNGRGVSGNLLPMYHKIPA